MVKMLDTAYRLKLVPADPDDFNSVPTWQNVREFRCAYRSISASENVRAGRDAGNTGLRIFYDPRMVSFDLGDKVKVNGKDYDIMYIPERSNAVTVTYIDTKAVQ